jgi:hypothetical protein
MVHAFRVRNINHGEPNRSRGAPAVLSIAIFAGCSSSAPPAGPASDVTFSAGPYTVDGGSELVMCSYVRGTNAAATDVKALQMAQTPGAHHLIVYTVDHPIDLAPHPCIQGGQPGWTEILISQNPTDEVTFPEGVGLTLQPNQQFAMEAHYINSSAAPATWTASFGMTYAPAGSVMQRAAPFVIGSGNIAVPPNGTYSTDVTCALPQDIEVFRVFGHEHAHGTGVTVARVGDASPLYQTNQWDHPPILQFDAGLPLAKGDQIHVSCDWANAGSTELSYPTEMCFAVGMYWPAPAGSPLFCAASGGRPSCDCSFQGNVEEGPGGSTIALDISVAATLPGAVGDPSAGKPIYCALFRDQDWGSTGPMASPRYTNVVEGVELTSPTTVATMTFSDVTPGGYRPLCYMDTINGGFGLGTGDPVNNPAAAPLVTAVSAQTSQGQVVLDAVAPGGG